MLLETDPIKRYQILIGVVSKYFINGNGQKIYTLRYYFEKERDLHFRKLLPITTFFKWSLFFLLPTQGHFEQVILSDLFCSVSC
jgi:hypothetical protein